AFRAHLGLYEDETSQRCDWHINEAHFLESWGDTIADDGTVGLIQPLIAPLYGGKSAPELLAVLTGDSGKSGYEIVRARLMGGQTPSPDSERAWRKSLHDGFVAGSAWERGWIGSSHAGPSENKVAEPKLELVFRPDPTIWDGRFANNGWLQELPKPIT